MIELATQTPQEFSEDDENTEASRAIEATRLWLEKAVIGLNLCPFAKAVHVRKQIRYAVSDARDTDTLTADLIAELTCLAAANEENLDTTLLIHPRVLEDFIAYNDYLAVADAIIDALGFSGEIQIASFHPHYRFEGSGKNDIENYTNRSPLPMLHLLRESSIERAVAVFPDTSTIYSANMETMRRLGERGWRTLFDSQQQEN